MYNPYDFYITPKEFAEAEANGICKKTLIWRIRRQGWSKQRALTEPVQFQDRERGRVEWSKWGKIAEKNGVSRSIFTGRLRLGWDSDKAANTPKIDPHEQAKRLSDFSPRTKRRKFSEELVKLAESNGISYSNLQQRVSISGWDPYTAATTPVMSPGEVRKKGREAFRQKYGSKPNAVFFTKKKVEREA
ncbi:hypothetical protein [Bacillus safensis]|uniref:hypothetical protein n=1 Tax=Bacillus safensis TaxID=561879 RepID=UPI000597CDB3|nr:hypothetical protein [Bacillus safensis]KIL16724.1 hypothetical protein B4129_2903 [Bacillus safensis]MCZ2740259.1 hypothetical protein [Bacillus safensis]